MKLDSMCIALRAGFGKILEEFDQPENLHSRDRFELKEDSFDIFPHGPSLTF